MPSPGLPPSHHLDPSFPTCAKHVEVKDGGLLVPAQKVGRGFPVVELLRQGPEDLALLQAGGEEPAGALLQPQPHAPQQLLGELPLLAVGQALGAGEEDALPWLQGHRRVQGVVGQQALSVIHHLLVDRLPPVVDGDIQVGGDPCAEQRSAAAAPKNIAPFPPPTPHLCHPPAAGGWRRGGRAAPRPGTARGRRAPARRGACGTAAARLLQWHGGSVSLAIWGHPPPPATSHPITAVCRGRSPAAPTWHGLLPQQHVVRGAVGAQRGLLRRGPPLLKHCRGEAAALAGAGLEQSILVVQDIP